MSYPFADILRAVYNGAERPDDSPGQLRALADWMDHIDNATDRELGLAGSTHRVERTMQKDLRRIAGELEDARYTIEELRASADD